MVNYNKALFILVGLAPAIALLLRGIVWGSDSFAFWSVSCGQSQYAGMLSSPAWFVWFIQEVINCNFVSLVFFMAVFYFLALFGLYMVGKRLFARQALLLPIVVGSLTPLFFLEALRFENDFFGWSLGFLALGLFLVFLERKNYLVLSLGCIIASFSIGLWFPSIFIILIAFFCLDIPQKHKNIVVGIGVIASLVLFWSYLTNSFTQILTGNLIGEEIPLIGLIFILHIAHYWNKIPQPFTFYGLILLLIGLIKSKYMFLATPFLIMSLLQKHLTTGLSIPKLQIPTLPLIPICFFLLIGWIVMIQFAYPTQTDLNEIQQAINLSKDLNIPLYNDWGSGWMFVSLGYDTNYKSSIPQPDWNNLSKPYIAYSKYKIGCESITTKISLCK
jgi:hypothetical protein